MNLTIERIADLKTSSRSYRLTASDQKIMDDLGIQAEQVVITWQQLDEHLPTVTVTAPTGPDGWHLPIPHRPDWLANLIRDEAPDWWPKRPARSRNTPDRSATTFTTPAPEYR
ncbi:hypothetical protein [Streptomyces misionensis]|uniref:hypothetical protein n=1 Tax=Streptomyces misionensis TaxID=67331 RepID=UPI0037009295